MRIMDTEKGAVSTIDEYIARFPDEIQEKLQEMEEADADRTA